MAEAEQPERLGHDRQVTVDDVRQLMGASTPHFALQLRNRIRTLIRGAAARGPGAAARRAGDRAARAARLHGRDARRAGAARPALAALAQRPRPASLRRGPDHRVSLSAGLERAIGLLDPARRPKSAAIPDGYLDLLGGAGRRGGRPAQRLMLTRGLPVVYERWWRPAWGRVLMGPLGPRHGRRAPDRPRAARARAGRHGARHRVRAGELRARVRGLGRQARARRRPRRLADDARPRGRTTRADAPNVAYIRGDAIRLPFRDGSFDAICCFAALHLFDEPLAALDAMARVLAPGGRVAILTTARAPLTPGAGRHARRRRDRAARVRPRRDHRARWRSAASRTCSARSPASPSSSARARGATGSPHSLCGLWSSRSIDPTGSPAAACPGPGRWATTPRRCATGCAASSACRCSARSSG